MNVNLAQYGCSLFFHAGKRAAVYSATNIQGLSANMPSDGHVAIILSHTGRNDGWWKLKKYLRKTMKPGVYDSIRRKQDHCEICG